MPGVSAIAAGLEVGKAPYRLERPLSGGRWTWLATDLRSAVPVVVKFERPGMPGGHAEGAILAKLTHPSIIPLLDRGLLGTRRRFHVVPFFVDGSLADFYQSGPLSLEQALKVTASVCSALTYCHGLHIRHGDIKPTNLFLDKAGLIIVSDFDAATSFAETIPLGGSGGVRATPDYAAPEILRGEEGTEASDVYSLAVTLAEGLTGKHPRREPRGFRSVDRAWAGASPVNRRVAKVLDNAMLDAGSPLRLPTARAFEAAFREAILGRAAHPIGPASEMTWWLTRGANRQLLAHARNPGGPLPPFAIFAAVTSTFDTAGLDPVGTYVHDGATRETTISLKPTPGGWHARLEVAPGYAGEVARDPWVQRIP
jgi:serine/threonine protein kinase